MSQEQIDRIRAHTDLEILAEIDRQIEERVRFYATQTKGIITLRIEELEREWDIDRWLETQASALALTGLFLGLTHNKKWFLLTGGVLGFLLQHALQGWCPPVPILRRSGIRTRSEIDREKFALKALRGDFERIQLQAGNNQLSRASDVLRAVSV